MHPRKNLHRDTCEPAIRAVLHKAGCRTYLLTGEAGVPDLLCRIGPRLFLIEVKRDAKAPFRAKQKAFRTEMELAGAGYYAVHDPDGALVALKAEMMR